LFPADDTGGGQVTDLLYQIDSYLKEFDATVVAVNGDSVALDRTAFYPGGGGQPNDLGTLVSGDRSWTVTKVKKEGENVWHTLRRNTVTPAGADGPGAGESAVSLPAAGTRVRGILDWDRRYRLMRTHSALHVLCGVVFRDYAAQVTGGNMEPLDARMDFEFERMQKDLVTEIERRVNEEIALGRAISVKILPREEAFQIPDLIRTKINLLPPGISEVRTVNIEGLDLQADGGTHVANTREIGRVKVVGYESKGKINKRIRIQVQ
jgi:misacylated tRNA(Ala) deacylase